MSHVTNRVGVEALRELLEEARFPVLAHVDGSEVVQTFPLASRWNESRFLVGLASGAFPERDARSPRCGSGLVLVWELVRCSRTACAGRPSGRMASERRTLPGSRWHADRVAAWDYGALHEEPQGAPRRSGGAGGPALLDNCCLLPSIGSAVWSTEEGGS
jgi:hypothetical protein